MSLSRAAVLAAILVTVSLALGAQAPQTPAGPLGRWRAEFTGPVETRPQMVSNIDFSIESTPKGLSGSAITLPEWPGRLEVTEIKVQGDRLSFVGTGKQGSTTGRADEVRYRCCPKLLFVGTVKGDEMVLTLTWTSTASNASARELPMKATRVR